MLKVNRNIQKYILFELEKKYPFDLEETELFDKIFKTEILYSLAPDICKQSEFTLDDCYYANLFYLQWHGLITFETEATNDENLVIENLSITAKGIDFIADDGGLSAILGVVTVKLHADTIKYLLVAKIDASDLSAEEKERYKSSLSTIKDAALTRITELVIENAPVATLLAAMQIPMFNS